jgi:4-hydroxy-3-polyprenylbenzoate decarboxylase
VVIAAAGPRRRDLGTVAPPDLKLPEGFSDPRTALPGILVIQGPRAVEYSENVAADVSRLASAISAYPSSLALYPLLVIVDDSEFTACTLNNFLWVAFTRSDPANDVGGVAAFVHRKHWGCRGPLIIDARLKPHMPRPLEADPAVTRRVDALFARGGPLQKVKEP